ncbi:hypothetical protein L6164_027141 [Bauhinia variegata]|uniref:Uncharacterized protein n=1 Tax=Bauhinia variegata TaxID=167791 RepID=A0ACB9LT00_BAUVA|nr:hypothetical protein L6164_027141 [Bauhinia variegata]
METQEYWDQHNKSADVYWKQRAKKADRANAKAAFADPYEISADLTSNVHEILVGNKTRAERILTGKNVKGPCDAFNPIDRGGNGGKIYVVIDPSDDDMMNPKPGTLRHAVIQTEPLWIIFAKSMVIRLREELIMTSYKAIDGRGAKIHIAGGAGITIQFIHNVIIHGIHIHDMYPGNGGIIRDSVDHFGLRTRSDGDAISIFGSNRVWIDHCSLYRATDGLVDSIMGSTAITISNNHFSKHNEMYVIGGSENPTIISEGNRYIAPDDLNAKRLQ